MWKGAGLHIQALAELLGKLCKLGPAFQQKIARIRRSNFTNVKTRVQALANAIQHCERPDHKGESSWEAERLIRSCQQQILTCGRKQYYEWSLETLPLGSTVHDLTLDQPATCLPGRHVSAQMN